MPGVIEKTRSPQHILDKALQLFPEIFFDILLHYTTFLPLTKNREYNYKHNSLITNEQPLQSSNYQKMLKLSIYHGKRIDLHVIFTNMPGIIEKIKSPQHA